MYRLILNIVWIVSAWINKQNAFRLFCYTLPLFLFLFFLYVVRHYKNMASNNTKVVQRSTCASIYKHIQRSDANGAIENRNNNFDLNKQRSIKQKKSQRTQGAVLTLNIIHMYTDTLRHWDRGRRLLNNKKINITQEKNDEKTLANDLPKNRLLFTKREQNKDKKNEQKNTLRLKAISQTAEWKIFEWKFFEWNFSHFLVPFAAFSSTR